MKSFKRLVSFLLVSALLTGILSLTCSAEDANENGAGDPVRCSCWYLDETYQKTAFEVIFPPQYVECAEEILISCYPFQKDEHDYLRSFVVQRKQVDEIGECFVLYLVTTFSYVYLYPNAFFDKDGNGNAEVCITGAVPSREDMIMQVRGDLHRNDDSEICSVEQGGSAEISFAVSGGTVIYDGETVARDVSAYTLSFPQTGEHTLVIRINELISRTYTFAVKTPEEMRKIRIAELKQELADTNKSFWRSIPPALFTVICFPILFFWPLTVVLPIWPFQIAGHFFETLSELWKLRS